LIREDVPSTAQAGPRTLQQGIHLIKEDIYQDGIHLIGVDGPKKLTATEAVKPKAASPRVY